MHPTHPSTWSGLYSSDSDYNDPPHGSLIIPTVINIHGATLVSSQGIYPQATGNCKFHHIPCTILVSFKNITWSCLLLSSSWSTMCVINLGMRICIVAIFINSVNAIIPISFPPRLRTMTYVLFPLTGLIIQMIPSDLRTVVLCVLLRRLRYGTIIRNHNSVNLIAPSRNGERTVLVLTFTVHVGREGIDVWAPLENFWS